MYLLSIWLLKSDLKCLLRLVSLVFAALNQYEPIPRSQHVVDASKVSSRMLRSDYPLWVHCLKGLNLEQQFCSSVDFLCVGLHLRP